MYIGACRAHTKCYQNRKNRTAIYLAELKVSLGAFSLLIISCNLGVPQSSLNSIYILIQLLYEIMYTSHDYTLNGIMVTAVQHNSYVNKYS